MAEALAVVADRDPQALQPREIEAAHLVQQLLRYVGEDPRREGLAGTPARVVRTLEFLTQGYEMDLDDVVNGAVFAATASEMVAVRGIEVYSLCSTTCCPSSAARTSPTSRRAGSSGSASWLASSICTRAACRSRSASPHRSAKRSRAC